jgi:hypothetical protein
MKHSLIIIIFTILFTGCTINMAPSQEQVENKVPAQTEMRPTDERRHKPWPREEKEYWYARYFHTMASHPGIQLRIKPEDVFAIVKCTMNKYEEEHSWEWFLENLGDVQILTPKNSQYVYVVTKACANQQKVKNPQPVGLRETI